MEPIVGLIVCLLTGALVVQELRRLVRQRLLRERADALCGLVDEPANGLGDIVAIDASATAFLDRLGLSPADVYGRAFLATGPIVLTLALVFAGWMIAAAVLAALALGHCLFTRWRRQKRTQEFTDHLPGFLERVRRLVLIGNTLPQAFIETLASADPVVRRQMEPFVRRTQYGASFTDCMTMLAQRNDIVELHMLAAYVRTNAKFGGRVAQTLTSLIDQLSNKRRLEREIKSATAETKASATILFGLMAFLIVFMGVMNPSFVAFYSGSDQGRMIFFAILCWPLLGAVVMRRILTLDF